MTDVLDAADPAAIRRAVELLRQGAVIGLPTDTIYGVGSLAFNAAAVAAIYRLKERPPDKAIPVFIPSLADLDRVCRDVSVAKRRFLARYWPGALTAVLFANPTLPGVVTNQGPTIAVRIPDHPVVAALLAAVAEPLAVTSANLSGQPTPATAQGVAQQLAGRLPLILDDGPSPGGQASTILDLTSTPARILRQGPLYFSAQELDL